MLEKRFILGICFSLDCNRFEKMYVGDEMQVDDFEAKPLTNLKESVVKCETTRE